MAEQAAKKMTAQRNTQMHSSQNYQRQKNVLSEISGSHSGKYKYGSLLRYSTT
jgi:hypothetical protein